MSAWRLILKELSFRAGQSALALCAVLVAVGTVTGARRVLLDHDRQEQALLDAREAEARVRMDSLRQTVRRAMDRLGFNVTILPEGQSLGDWYAKDYAAMTLPEEAIRTLRATPLATIEKPVAQLRQKIEWPERKWTVIVVGTEGRIPKSSATGAVEPLPAGTVWLGHEIHRGLDIQEGTRVSILGREFQVARCLDAEGSNEDITIWMPLAEAQALLDKKGLINEIVAVEALAARGDVAAVNREVSARLPGVRVIEQTSKLVAKLQARMNTVRQVQEAVGLEREAQARLSAERGRMGWVLNGLVLLVCGAWIGLLALANAMERRTEIGAWQALGWRFARVIGLIGGKWCLLAFVGGVAGFVGGTVMAIATGISTDTTARSDIILTALGDAEMLGLALGLAIGLALLGSWIPLAYLARQDPAVVLQGE